ncbi:Kinesin-like protein [Spraguea lophii 42_110]|uniref:Kinesin-like protein n=1 Tax=Spraguea lophii (strain 42_110) TaxID=1358809 RepID=S7W6G7_SPRLO|nr:Kinesin-like protein [Spraguea lophii 42_110]
MDDNIKTILRIKPTERLNTTHNSITIDNHTFYFDQIHSDSTQLQIFDNVAKDVILSSLQGYNCTLFAYGQTGSGKTYTIQGDTHNKGIIPRILYFLLCKEKQENLEIEITFIEIYNEQLLDLLSDNEISIREDINKGVIVENGYRYTAVNYDDTMKVYYEGVNKRKTSETKMNKISSRSHSVFTIYFKEKNGTLKTFSKLNIVDLAGSERIRYKNDIGNESIFEEIKYDDRVKETGNINKSLLCLGEVIKKLSKDKIHINYRDSKLTFLLKDSLGGNSKLVVIGTIESKYKNESISTLKFLQRVKSIQNNPVANTDITGTEKDLKQQIIELFCENKKLKVQLLANEENENKSRNIDSKEIEEILEEIENIKKLIEEVKEGQQKYKEILFNRDKYGLKEIESYYNKMKEERENDLNIKKRKYC